MEDDLKQYGRVEAKKIWVFLKYIIMIFYVYIDIHAAHFSDKTGQFWGKALFA